jgi:CBS domain-containing protein
LTISLASLVAGFSLIQHDVVIGIWSLTIGVLLLTMLISSNDWYRRGRRSKPGSVEAVMNRDVVIVPPSLNVQDFINRVLKNNRFTSFPVAEEGRLHGLILLSELKSVPRERWPDLTARDVMRPVDESMFIATTAPVAEAAALLASNGIGRAAVIDSAGLVVGYLSESDLNAGRRPIL